MVVLTGKTGAMVYICSCPYCM